MQRIRSGLYPVAFIDDDPAKLNLHSRAVVGDRYKIPEVVPSLHIHQSHYCHAYGSWKSDSGNRRYLSIGLKPYFTWIYERSMVV